MTRNTAREIAVHLSYEMNFNTQPVDQLLDRRLTHEAFASLSEENELYREAPDVRQDAYIRRLVIGVCSHAAELDSYIEKYAVKWKFSRIPMVATAIMRVAMFEILYMPDIPNRVSINEAVEIAKKYETSETVKFINGILGSFVREEIPEERTSE
jgi:N utilization substance protein B